MYQLDEIAALNERHTAAHRQALRSLQGPAEPVGSRSPRHRSSVPRCRRVAGEFVRRVLPHAEADPAALLLQFLAWAGNVAVPGLHCRVEGVEYPARLWVFVVGRTSRRCPLTAPGAPPAAGATWRDRQQPSGWRCRSCCPRVRLAPGGIMKIIT